MRQQRISPEKFDRLQRVIMLMENDGASPEAAIIQACRVIRIEPPTPFEGVEIIVDYSLS